MAYLPEACNAALQKNFDYPQMIGKILRVNHYYTPSGDHDVSDVIHQTKKLDYVVKVIDSRETPKSDYDTFGAAPMSKRIGGSGSAQIYWPVQVLNGDQPMKKGYICAGLVIADASGEPRAVRNYAEVTGRLRKRWYLLRAWLSSSWYKHKAKQAFQAKRKTGLKKASA